MKIDNWKTLIFAIALLAAVVVLAAIRDDVVTVVLAIVGAAAGRWAHHSTSGSEKPNGGPGVSPVLLAALGAPFVLSCSGGSQVVSEPTFEGGSIEVVTGEAGEHLELSAEASGSFGLVRGHAGVDMYVDSERADVTAALTLTILNQIGGSLVLSCDVYAETCELCVLSGKESTWCHTWEAETDGDR